VIRPNFNIIRKLLSANPLFHPADPTVKIFSSIPARLTASLFTILLVLSTFLVSATSALDKPEPSRNHLREYVITGDYRKVRHCLNRLETAKNPRDTRSLFLLGYTSLRLNDYRGAENYFKKIIGTGYVLEEYARYYLAAAYSTHRKHRQSLATLAPLLELNPSHPLFHDAFRAYIKTLTKLNRFDEAA